MEHRHGTVNLPNSVENILPSFVSTALRLFYIRSKMFSYLAILWVLLFQMIIILFVRYLSCFHSDIIDLRKVIALDRIR